MKAVFTAFFVFISLILFAQKPIEIKGKLLNNTFEKIEIAQAYTTDAEVLASSPILPDGSFTLRFTAVNPELYRFRFSEKENMLAAFTPGEKVIITINANDLSNIESVTGSKSMELIKDFIAKSKEPKELLSEINNNLQQDETQIYFNNFYKSFAPFVQTNKEIDEHIIVFFDETQTSANLVNRYSKNGAINTKMVDSLLLNLPEVLKQVRDHYQAFENYKEHIRNNYDFSDGSLPGHTAFYGNLAQYTTILDQRHNDVQKVGKEYIEEIKKVLTKYDDLKYSGLLENKKQKISLANEMATIVNSHIKEIGNTASDYKSKVAQAEQLAKEISTYSQTTVSGIVARYQKEYDNKNAALNQKMEELLINNKSNLAVLMFMDYFPKDKYPALHSEIIKALYEKYPQNIAVKERYAIMTSPQYTTAIGSLAPDLAFQNPDGKILKLSDLKGKYVLLDFWASWCGPCRRENPHVVKEYEKYKDKGFEVFSVSLDRDKNSWIAAIQKDNLKWPNHVSDLKYWSSDAAKIYGVNSIPATFLIDKDGKIIAKNLRGAELSKALLQIFGE